MYTCEICGEPTDQKIFRKIEGVQMLVCRNCMMMGEKPHSERQASPVQKKAPKYYLDKPEYLPRTNTTPLKSPKPVTRGPKNLPIDRLRLVDNYRDILRKIRIDNDLDQGQFSNSVGITHTSYKHIESGRLDLTIQEAKRIEKKFEVTLTELIEDPEEDEFEQYMRGGTSSPSKLGDVYVKRKR